MTSEIKQKFKTSLYFQKDFPFCSECALLKQRQKNYGNVEYSKKLTQLTEWLNSNIGKFNVCWFISFVDGDYKIYFKNEEDAVMFTLVWG